VHINDVINCTG